MKKTNQMKTDLELYQKNLDLFYQTHSKENLCLESIDPASVQFCTTLKGEPNLQKNEKGEVVYYHSQAGALEESKELFRNIFLLKANALFIYGAGLGYYYDGLKEWLDSAPFHYLIFLEDDLRVVRRFLETEKATEILTHPQVVFKAFKRPGEFDWGKFRKDLDWIFWAFARTPFEFFCHPLYLIENNEFANLLYGQIGMNLNDRAGYLYFNLERYIQVDIPYLYQNFLHIDGSYNGQELYEEFKDIPAVICGAGPSLAKQINDLKDLENKALIFAAGSALNALNAHGVEAHFAGGIDPLKAQISRMRTNFAFMVPLFYADCYSHESFLLHHGPKIYLKAKFHYPIHEWFLEQLSLSNQKEINLGRSTPGFCLNVASALGCNPLIFAGMDLAYTSSKRYTEGIQSHPLDDPEEKKMIKDVSEGRIKIPGIDGKEIYTKWAWVQEGGGYSEYALGHPEKQVFNSTPEGLPLVDIPHLSLKQIESKYFGESYDLLNFIHASIQNASLGLADKTKAREILKRWSSSLQNCRDHYAGEYEEAVQEGSALGQEPAFRFFLKKLGEAFDFTTYLEKRIAKDEEAIARKKNRFITDVIDSHIKTIEACLNEPEPAELPLAAIVEKQGTCPDNISNANLKKKTYYYKNGSVKGESHFSEGILEGPSTFYSSTGLILGQSTFSDGKREGKTFQYTKDGKVDSIQNFLHGKRHGKQSYFYPKGNLKAEINYAEGALDGAAILYYPNGFLKRELHFSKGNLHGIERLWNPAGALISEVKYENNLPVDRAREWHPNGQVAKEFVYYESPEKYDYYEWDPNGKLIKKNVYLSSELVEDYAKKSELLKKQMEDVLAKIKKLQDT